MTEIWIEIKYPSHGVTQKKLLISDDTYGKVQSTKREITILENEISSKMDASKKKLTKEEIDSRKKSIKDLKTEISTYDGIEFFTESSPIGEAYGTKTLCGHSTLKLPAVQGGDHEIIFRNL